MGSHNSRNPLLHQPMRIVLVVAVRCTGPQIELAGDAVSERVASACGRPQDRVRVPARDRDACKHVSEIELSIARQHIARHHTARQHTARLTSYRHGFHDGNAPDLRESSGVKEKPGRGQLLQQRSRRHLKDGASICAWLVSYYACL